MTCATQTLKGRKARKSRLNPEKETKYECLVHVGNIYASPHVRDTKVMSAFDKGVKKIGGKGFKATPQDTKGKTKGGKGGMKGSSFPPGKHPSTRPFHDQNQNKEETVDCFLRKLSCRRDDA